MNAESLIKLAEEEAEIAFLNAGPMPYNFSSSIAIVSNVEMEGAIRQACLAYGAQVARECAQRDLKEIHQIADALEKEAT